MPKSDVARDLYGKTVEVGDKVIFYDDAFGAGYSIATVSKVLKTKIHARLWHDPDVKVYVPCTFESGNFIKFEPSETTEFFDPRMIFGHD